MVSTTLSCLESIFRPRTDRTITSTVGTPSDCDVLNYQRLQRWVCTGRHDGAASPRVRKAAEFSSGCSSHEVRERTQNPEYSRLPRSGPSPHDATFLVSMRC